jgi:hypothetical protein
MSHSKARLKLKSAAVAATLTLSVGLVAPAASTSAASGPNLSLSAPTVTAEEEVLIEAAKAITRTLVGKQRKIQGGVIVVDSATAVYPGMPAEIREKVNPPLALVNAVWAPYYSLGNPTKATVDKFFKRLEARYGVPIARTELFYSPMPVLPDRVAPRVKGVSDANPGTAVTTVISGIGFNCSAGVYGTVGRTNVLLTAGHCLHDGSAKASSYKDAEGDSYNLNTLVTTPWNGVTDRGYVASTGSVRTVPGPGGTTYDIAGYRSLSQLKPGTTLCRVGMKSGASCNMEVITTSQVTSNGEDRKTLDRAKELFWYRSKHFYVEYATQQGDSGGVLYTLEGGKAYIAGIQSVGFHCYGTIDANRRCSNGYATTPGGRQSGFYAAGAVGIDRILSAYRATLLTK